MELAIKSNENKLTFVGKLDESVTVEAFEKSYAGLNSPNEIYLDFRDVSRANSIGIWNLLKFLATVEKKIVYINCPLWLVEQFNINSEFLKGDKEVKSFYAPYFHAESDESYNHLFKIGENLDVTKIDVEEEFEEIEIKGSSYVCDFDPEAYFKFLK